MPPTSPITQWLGNGCGHAGSSTNPGDEPFFSTAIPSARRSATRAFCKASVADCCAPTDAMRHTLATQASVPARTTSLRILEIIVSPPSAVFHDSTRGAEQGAYDARRFDDEGRE